MLLMLTLPVQALAYAAMQGCVLPNPRAAEAPAQREMPDEAMADCHMSVHAPDPSGPHAPIQHDCKFCAACGLASAMPADFVVRMPAVPGPNGYALPPAALFSGFIPDGPERPPRSSFA